MWRFFLPVECFGDATEQRPHGVGFAQRCAADWEFAGVAAGAVVTVAPDLVRASPMVFGLMTLSYAGAMAMAWISRRPAATALAA